MFHTGFERDTEEEQGRRGHCGRGPWARHHRGGWGEFGGRFGGRGFGSAVRGRFFESGDLRFVILKLISEKPRHGYDVIKAIEEKLGGGYAPSPGVVYPTLTLLEEMGYVSATSEGTKKLYTITPEGEEALKANQGVIDALFARMEAAGAAMGRGRDPRLVRAIENFRTALKLKWSGAPLTEEQVRKIAAAIDAAAKAVEES